MPVAGEVNLNTLQATKQNIAAAATFLKACLYTVDGKTNKLKVNKVGINDIRYPKRNNMNHLMISYNLM